MIAVQDVNEQWHFWQTHHDFLYRFATMRARNLLCFLKAGSKMLRQQSYLQRHRLLDTRLGETESQKRTNDFNQTLWGS